MNQPAASFQEESGGSCQPTTFTWLRVSLALPRWWVGGDAAPSLGHSPCGLVSLQKQFPSRQEKSYPGWVQAICGLLSFLPALLVPGVAMAQLPIWRRQKQENVQQNMRLKLQDSKVSDSEVC